MSEVTQETETLADAQKQAVQENVARTAPEKDPVEEAAKSLGTHPGVVGDGAKTANAAADPLEQDFVDAPPPDHPAVATLEGPGAQIGHRIDVTSADRKLLPVHGVVADEQGRVWMHVRTPLTDDEIAQAPKDSVFDQFKEELVLLGRLVR